MIDFIIENWKWIVATLFTLLGLILAFLEFNKKNKNTNYQKSGNKSINIQSSKDIKINKNE